jgi:hypothetical protein
VVFVLTSQDKEGFAPLHLPCARSPLRKKLLVDYTMKNNHSRAGFRLNSRFLRPPVQVTIGKRKISRLNLHLCLSNRKAVDVRQGRVVVWFYAGVSICTFVVDVEWLACRDASLATTSALQPRPISDMIKQKATPPSLPCSSIILLQSLIFTEFESLGHRTFHHEPD